LKAANLVEKRAQLLEKLARPITWFGISELSAWMGKRLIRCLMTWWPKKDKGSGRSFLWDPMSFIVVFLELLQTLEPRRDGDLELLDGTWDTWSNVE